MPRGSVATTNLDPLRGDIMEMDPNPVYFAAPEELTAESWLSEAEEDDDDDFDDEDEDLDDDEDDVEGFDFEAEDDEEDFEDED